MIKLYRWKSTSVMSYCPKIQEGLRYSICLCRRGGSNSILLHTLVRFSSLLCLESQKYFLNRSRVISLYKKYREDILDGEAIGQLLVLQVLWNWWLTGERGCFLSLSSHGGDLPRAGKPEVFAQGAHAAWGALVLGKIGRDCRNFERK